MTETEANLKITLAGVVTIAALVAIQVLMDPSSFASHGIGWGAGFLYGCYMVDCLYVSGLTKNRKRH